jgi:hypothetical protein
MIRKDLDYLVIAAMLLNGLYVTLSGLVADLFGLHQFAFHCYAGYLCAGLAIVHMALNWGRITAYLRRRLRRAERRERPAPSLAERAPLLGRRGFLVSAPAAAGGFAMGLGPCAVGAFLDDDLNDMLGLDGAEEAVLCVISAGKV